MSDALAIAALVISIAAAAFTGWQAISAHATRRDARRIHLILVPNPRASYGPVLDEPTWVLDNAGDGTATNVAITLSYDHGEHHRDWTTHLSTITGRTRHTLDLDDTPVTTTLVDGGPDTVGQYLTCLLYTSDAADEL